MKTGCRFECLAEISRGRDEWVVGCKDGGQSHRQYSEIISSRGKEKEQYEEIVRRRFVNIGKFIDNIKIL